MNEQINTTPQIGKDVIESLTLGMYEDCRFIYREYIQNAADAVDKAIECNLLKKGEEAIHVRIDKDNRSISVQDNATGIPQEKVMAILRNIAHSTKKRGEDKGFRGIGRLGGLGYCSKLIFETSYYGESVKSIMTWDADLLKYIINDREDKEEATEVLAKVTKLETKDENIDAHYFNVIMEDVSLDDLLDVESVSDYLSMVAPVDISSRFIFRQKINDFKKENGLVVDTYNIFVNDDQIYKPYTSVIYDEGNGGKKKVDDIVDVKFLLEKDDNGSIIYWGWYSISTLRGQMKPLNLARGIRLRKENIQIGDEEICKKFFTKTEDQRFSFYYFGEIHAVSKGLIPNSRRDYFAESKECVDFEQKIREDFLKLKDLCYDAQKLRSSTSTIIKTEELRATIHSKEKNGYTSQKERDDLHHRLEEQEKKEEQAQKQLAKVKDKISSKDSPLKSVLNKFETSIPTKEQPKEDSEQVTSDKVKEAKTRYRTDKPIYSRYSKSEKKLIGKIYTAISNAIADERLREALISNIEEQITK
ncbi:MAG TPA: ATP-binding protein [Prevotellaceae bacterium]|nr:ATP-binding protein [Prevotellaceae bacterium]